MKFVAYKLAFTTGVHFGSGTLDSAEMTASADTLFSALCQEAVKQGRLDALVDAVNEGKLLLSDLMPYIGSEYFLPKPILYIGSGDDESEGDSVVKKAYKKMTYIPASQFQVYLKGNMPLEKTHALQDLGHFDMKVSAAIHEQADTEPYRIKIFSFSEGSGLYVVISLDDSLQNLLDELMASLSHAGIGGRRSSGFGKFHYEKTPLPAALQTALTSDGSRYMSLSVSLPREAEIESALEGASYQVIKRSGFVGSDTYSDTALRKKDLMALKAGSVFRSKFRGGVYDVSSFGAHPVYRYAVPMFMAV